MPQSTGLCGRSFLVTRPEGQAEGLLAVIRALGGHAAHIPFLAIEPVPAQGALEAIARASNDYAATIFISANAVRMAWLSLSAGQDSWPENRVAACIGPGTARALVELGVHQIIVPAAQYDTEGLLAEAFFAQPHCEGKAFALIRGEGGRDVLAQSLRARGARVDEVAVYRRTLHPDALERLQDWMASGGGTLLISSSESLRCLISAAPRAVQQELITQPLLVPHSRIAEVARELGFNRVTVTAGGDVGMLDALRSYNAGDT